MATLGSLIISLEANTAKFEAAMTKAQYTAKKSADAIKATLLGIGTALAGAISVKAIEEMITSVAKMESAMLKTATRLNTSVETLSSFGVMARKTGMDTDAFYLALTRMEKGMSVAGMKAEEATNQVDENGEAITKANTAYNALGLNVDVLLKMPLDQQLMAIAEAFKNNIAPADRVNIAMQLFGKTGSGMINVLKDGAEGVQKLVAEQQNLGIITTEAAKKSAEFNAATANLDASWEIFKRNIAEGVIPTLANLISKMNDAISTAKRTREELAIYEAQFPGVAHPGYEMTTGAGVGPFGEAAGEPGAVSPMPYTPPAGLTKPPVRPGGISKAGGGGGGKGGSGDAGLDRMSSIIDTLQKDLSRLTEGSLAEIKAWAAKMGDEIAKVGRKGADTATAMALKDQVEKAKMKKATEDYELFVAKESGDAYKQIEADAREWLTKYKGFANSEITINAIKKRRIGEEDSKQASDRLSLQKSFLDSISSEMPLLSQQLEMRKKLLPIEMELRRLELDRQMASLKLTNAQKDEFRSLMAMEAQAKKYSLERAKWSTKGIAGGVQIYGLEKRQEGETATSQRTLATIKKAESGISNVISNSIIGALTGAKTDFAKIGLDIATAFIQTTIEMAISQLFTTLAGVFLQSVLTTVPTEMATATAVAAVETTAATTSGAILTAAGATVAAEMIAGATEAAAILTAANAASSLLFFHSGGVVNAHRGWPWLASDEVPIIAQTGERVLSRRQNREYEAGYRAGGSSDGSGAPITMVNNFRYQMTQAEWDRAIKLQIIPGIKKANANRGGGLS